QPVGEPRQRDDEDQEQDGGHREAGEVEYLLAVDFGRPVGLDGSQDADQGGVLLQADEVVEQRRDDVPPRRRQDAVPRPPATAAARATPPPPPGSGAPSSPRPGTPPRRRRNRTAPGGHPVHRVGLGGNHRQAQRRDAQPDREDHQNQRHAA